MQFIFQGKKYIVSARLNARDNISSFRGKTTLYLLQVQPDGKRKYLSSLYSTGNPNEYRFEYLGKFYILDLGNTRGNERIFSTCTSV